MRKRTQQRGFTMLELLIVVAILGVLASIAAPSFNDAMESRRLSSAVEAIYSDMRYARSESIKRSNDVTVTFTDGASWSYVIADGSGTIKTVSNTQFSIASITSGFASTPHVLTFDYVRGTANNGTITITADDGTSGTVTISAIGRIKSDY